MRILHISDTHLSRENEKDFRQYYLKSLLADVKAFHETKKVDLVAITGDLFHRGGLSFASDPAKNTFEFFQQLFSDEIAKIVGGDVPIVYTPGNHDLVLTPQTQDEIVENGLTGSLTTIDKINQFIDTHKNDDYLAFKKQDKYKAFEKALSYNGCIDRYSSNFESAYIFEVAGVRVGVVAFNSSWRCSPDIPAKVPYFGSRQVLDAADFFEKNRTDFNIGLVHHSPHLFEDLERREVIKFLETKRIDFLFCGHTHRTDNVCLYGPQGNVFFLTARSAFNDPRQPAADYSPGYSILDFDRQQNRYECHFRKYIHQRVEFDADVEAAPSGTASGLLSIYPGADSFKEIISLTTGSFEPREEDLDSALVTFGTKTNAPQRLRELFVHPKLTNAPENYSAASSITYGSLDSIINAGNHILIFGRKETGKTTLLNCLYSELSCAVHQYQKIPVRLDFNEFEDKEAITLIRTFLNVPTNKVKRLLSDGSIVLLLDNVLQLESRYGVSAIGKLEKLVEEYPATKIIGTSSIDFESIVTDDTSFFNKMAFVPIYINSVGTEQFKSLALRWFRNKDQVWLNEHLTKLIKTFDILRIPHTFFSITLFLWIIEKQENFKPQNQAMLVDTFLRYILEGLRSEEVKAGAYNFERKIEVLAEIAIEMYRNGNRVNNYSLRESEVIACVEKNFAQNQRSWIASQKVEEFLEKGILWRTPSDNKAFAFRFESFFKYLLSMNMDANPSFLSEAMERKNILSFIDELDFYTARSQNSRAILDHVFCVLEEAFEDLNSKIDDNIDQYLPKRGMPRKSGNDGEMFTKLKKSKLTDEEIEAQLSEQFESLPVSTSIQIKREADHKAHFNKVLELACRVLKNSENIKDPATINTYLARVLKLSGKYGIYFQSLIMSMYKENQQTGLPFPKEFLVLISPLINQILLLTWLGTDFLEVPLRLQVEKQLANSRTSELELYLSVFVYSDMHFPGYLKFLEKAISRIHSPYVAELFLMKTFLYYMMRANNSTALPELEHFMKKLLVKARGVEKGFASKFIQKVYRKQKLGPEDEESKKPNA